MANLDTTGWGIITGLVTSISYTALRTWRLKSFDIADIGSTILLFLAGFAVPAGLHLITAALLGNPIDLPTSWREYVTVAGIAVIYLSAKLIFESFARFLAKQEVAMPETNVADMSNETNIDE